MEMRYPIKGLPIGDRDIEEVVKKRIMELLVKEELSDKEIGLLGILASIYIGLKEE